ncbi:sigma-70 family RNA polymerase sigma factor [Streptomyces poriferorum]|uniref:RNA polymerase sigma factor n=1 Tax=Streptomyces poriferorum TaxID=2798799 RepID=A0ABY9IGC8_9ACTN|nr:MULTISPECIES: sigma-70 family RNA polymerase sigma factor [unclassified Streptomyces]MDP5315788.1 sigma-70 family RNA polymerase sigma factor [Streptomyces sp. Alt4]WLQ54145.1 sigma-70 family RNA polymerase sigma factor [Streptomyces sp. Alt2]
MSNQHTTDPVALVNAARNGDVEAQDALASAYLPLLYNIVGRALNASSDVDDVVQDTMLRALDGLNGLRTPESFRSWLVAIAMNRVRAHWQDGMAAPGPLEEAGEVADPGADFVDLTMVRLQLSGQRLETARATRWLEPDDRSLLSLWWLECAGELTRSEVAEALELSSQSTAVRVQRMKAQLETARVVVRALDAQPPCQELRRTLTAWDGRPSALWRKRIARHARDCVRCAGMWSGLMPAEGLLAGLALVPVPAVLLALYQTQDGRMTPISAARPLDPAASDGAIAAASGRHRSSGKRNSGGRSTSRADARRRRRNRRRAASGAVLAACMTGGGLWYMSLGPGESSRGDSTARTSAGPVADLAAPETAAPTTPPPLQSASASATASPSVKRSSSATPSRTPKKSVAPTPTVAPAPRVTATPPVSVSTTAQVVSLVNKERAAAGCGGLTEDSQLTDAAQRHSDDMAARDFFEHTNPDGADPGQRVTDAGYRWSTYGENIARGQQTPESVMESWMNSPGHRANILNCSFKNIGIGIHKGSGGPWWTQDFGAK